jgi:hypothetical protein
MYQRIDHQFSTYLCFSLKQKKMSILSWCATQMFVCKWLFMICLRVAIYFIKCSDFSEISHWFLKMMSFVSWRRIRSIVASFAFCNRALNRLLFESRSTNINDWYSTSRKKWIDFSLNWSFKRRELKIILLAECVACDAQTFRSVNAWQIDVKSNSNEMNLNQKKSEFESRSENAKMSSISFNTSINRKRISDNSRAKRATHTLFVVTKKQKRNVSRFCIRQVHQRIKLDLIKLDLPVFHTHIKSLYSRFSFFFS